MWYDSRRRSEAINLIERITIQPDLCHGKPTVRGLRYPVEMILELLSFGMTPDEILADYEDLEREDSFAALAFATRLSRIKRIELVTLTCRTYTGAPVLGSIFYPKTCTTVNT